MLAPQERLTNRLIDALYIEAMLLADEARAYFDEHGRADRELLAPLERVSFTCESLKVTTRLMHIIAWLLTHRAIEAGEITAEQARTQARRLGHAADSPAALAEGLPPTARALIAASCDLHARVHRLDQRLDRPSVFASPARTLMDRLERAF